MNKMEGKEIRGNIPLPPTTSKPNIHPPGISPYPKVYEVKGKLADSLMIKVEEVDIIGETDKTFLISSTSGHLLRKKDIGNINSGLFYGSFKCFCYEKDIEAFKQQITDRVIQYHVANYLKELKNVEKLLDDGHINHIPQRNIYS